ncbi:MAG TPA: hypothetical protein DEV75_05410 [Desulfovibrio sp.]|nr:hypothetical protein [Desulfovibrio sp.]
MKTIKKSFSRILSTSGSIGIIASLYFFRPEFTVAAIACLGLALYLKASLEDMLSTLSACFVCLGLLKQAWWPVIIGAILFIIFMRLPYSTTDKASK